MLSKIFIGYFICVLKMVLGKAKVRGDWEWFEGESEFSKKINEKEEITFQIAC